MSSSHPPSEALLLFAHGSSDPAWARPFEALRDRVAAREPGRAIALAYLERMHPSFDEAVDTLNAQGVTRISVAPLFLAPGGHVREDLPRLIEAARARTGIVFDLRSVLGESDAMLDAMARWIAEGG
ncbi:MAG: CbiX/SirB N-terminal domain-containing protein [Betaproteobacteria bacterium]|nr:CbiX/SirB N-terminal domain-containing protein [Betaproteobacteria bacterium]